ncbi:MULTISPECIES: FAD-dependent monooxygenase [unclassified Amycolatopsis]|uniref:FAD-dependent monooxygenase n=1 Tax=unclassified Amycolatopsis TaxID=2618356 RepID=UPI00106F059D|nr:MULTISPECIES: FAD-dependent monooxygenase [unclassified Amycolatopsis]
MYDAVIVGAGPIGLFLACELGLAGSSVLVLEREPEPGSPWRTAPLGLRGLSATSIEAFHRRGMLPPLLAASDIHDLPSDERPRSAGHFAGMVLDPAKIAVDALPYWLPSSLPGGMMTNLDAIEAVLSEQAAKFGVEIRRGVEVSGVEQHEDGVLVRAGEQEYAARWAIGCDGGRSVVRGLAGFEFVGTEPQFTGYTMLVDVADPEKLSPGFNLTPNGMYVQMPAPGHFGVLDFDHGAFDRTRRPSLEHLQTVLRRVSGTDVTLTGVRLVSTFTDRAMQTTTYRRGRVLLAGDAAHIHSPLGGQGLNTGISDAVNLGWKLGAVVRGEAPEAILDSYPRERHPIGAWVLDWTRAQAAAMRPDAHGQAVQGVLRDLLSTRDGTTYVYGKMSGASLRYDLGDEHPLIGRYAPDFQLANGIRLGDLMRDGRGVVLDFSADERLRETAGRLRYAAGPAKEDFGLGAVLVRPDGIVAWAGDRDFSQESFIQAKTQWFGEN